MACVPERCPECGVVFKSYRALSNHLDRCALTRIECGSSASLNTHKTVDKDGGAYSRRVAPMRLVLRCMCARIVLLP